MDFYQGNRDIRVCCFINMYESIFEKEETMSDSLTIFIKSLDLSTTFAISIMAIVLVGILMTELSTRIRGGRARNAAYALLALVVLTETAIILDFIANTASILINLLIVEIVVALSAITLGVGIVVYFHDLIRKRLLYTAIAFGIPATLGVVGTLIWDSPVARIIGILGANGVIILLYLIILTFILDYRKKHHIR